jgi:para-nitrobenzyl esterase
MLRQLLHAAALLAAAPAAAQTADAPPDPSRLAGTAWRWIAFTTPVEQIAVPDPERYTLAFSAEGTRVALRADCNRGAGAVAFPEPHRIAFGALALTRAMCPEPTLGERFARELSRAAIWFERDGDLFFDLPYDSGTLRFRRAGAP